MTQNRRTAVVTGGIGGIGTVICQRLAKDGHQVVATYHPSEEDKLGEWSKAQEALGLEIGLIGGDVSSAEDGARMM